MVLGKQSDVKGLSVSFGYYRPMAELIRYLRQITCRHAVMGRVKFLSKVEEGPSAGRGESGGVGSRPLERAVRRTLKMSRQEAPCSF